MLANKNSTKFILLSILFIASLVFLSSDALAAKKGTISADRCKGGVIIAKVSGYTPSYVYSSFIFKGSKVYSGRRSATTTDGGTLYRYSRAPKSAKGARITFSTTDKTYSSTLASALKKGKGKLC